VSRNDAVKRNQRKDAEQQMRKEEAGWTKDFLNESLKKADLRQLRCE
jgi:hypothetical protein